MPHALDAHRRTQHALTGIRSTEAQPHAATLAPTAAASLQPAVSHALPAPTAATRPRVMRPLRDGAARVGSLPVLEKGNRLNVGKPATALGWAPGAGLVLCLSGAQATVHPGSPATPAEHAVTVDGKDRLRLPPAALGCLGVVPGDQVLVIAVPTRDALQLLPATEVLQALTGWIAPPPAAEPEKAEGATVSRILPRWPPTP